MTTFDLHEPIEPRVPEVLLRGATPIERHMLEQLSVGEQQRSRMVQVLGEVKEQTEKTNGRVTALEGETKEPLMFVQRFRKMILWAVAVVGPCVGTVTFILLDKFLDKWLGK